MTDIVRDIMKLHNHEGPEAADEIERLRLALTELNTEVCQRLGKALGYPWFKDDQKNFPGATEENGVCTGEHVAESIAAEAARRIGNLEAERDEAVAALALYRAENGCTRGQRTTQWCGEAIRLREALEGIAKGVANGPRCHAIARAALKETPHD